MKLSYYLGYSATANPYNYFAARVSYRSRGSVRGLHGGNSSGLALSPKFNVEQNQWTCTFFKSTNGSRSAEYIALVSRDVFGVQRVRVPWHLNMCICVCDEYRAYRVVKAKYSRLCPPRMSHAIAIWISRTWCQSDPNEQRRRGVTWSFFSQGLGLALTAKLCPDRPQIIKKVNNGQAFR